MADTKISALTASTTPLAGTEVLPIVQSSTTKQVSVANLTAGRAVSAASLALTTSPLPTTSGGTALTSFTANGIVYASSSSALATSSTLNFTNGNLGVDATPSPWSWPTGATGTIEIRAGGALSGYNGGTYLSNNWYYNAGEKFIANGYATRYDQTTGKHTWYVSNASNAGDAGAGVTWTTLGGWGANSDFTLNGGNVVVSNGKGIDFSATPGTGTSELFADYEEGTWTPVATWVTQGSGTSSGNAYYTKVGRTVTLLMYITASKGTASGKFTVTGVPYAPATAAACATRIAGMGAALQVVYVNITSTTMNFDLNDQGTTYGSNVTAAQMATDCYIQVTCTYNI
jgi:hypothetical protein